MDTISTEFVTSTPTSEGTYWIEGSLAWDLTARFKVWTDTEVLLDNADWPSAYRLLAGVSPLRARVDTVLRSVIPPIQYTD